MVCIERIQMAARAVLEYASVRARCALVRLLRLITIPYRYVT